MRGALVASAVTLATLHLASARSVSAQRTVESWLIANATLVDGTGAPARPAAVRVRGDRVLQLGDLRPLAGERVIDASGLVLAPGFIDTHSHHDRGLDEQPEALAAVSQGITTIVVGQDGASHQPLAEWLVARERTPAAVNLASFAGHNTLRRRILGDDARRPATAEELSRMRALLREDLAAGALGLSTGLEYDPGISATTEEIVALAREAAAVGGRYVSHIRSEDRSLWDAVEEAIRIAREGGLPVQISHLKLAMRGLWGETDRLLRRLDEARAAHVEVTADVYPYDFWQSTMTVLFPERDFTNRESAAFALEELVHPEGLVIARYDPRPDYAGKTIAQVAALRGSDPVTTLMDLIAESRATGGGESIIATSMREEDIARLLAWPHTNVCSDGELDGRHPRGFGSFPRVLGRYVRELGILTPEQAVHKMTGLAAEHVGFSDRGVIRPGAYADLVLLDLRRVADRATLTEPHGVAEGIERVWVNGIEVYSGGAATGARPGRVLRREP
jgi:N-acyl-D-amino-acid deacylase